MEWTSLGFPQCVHYFSHGGTVGWDGHFSDSGECPKNIRTILDSHCTIGHLLAMLDTSAVWRLQLSHSSEAHLTSIHNGTVQRMIALFTAYIGMLLRPVSPP